MDELHLLTAVSLADLLGQVEEFKDFDIEVEENSDGKITLTVNDSVYSIQPDESTVTDADIDDNLIEEISNAEDEAVENIRESNDGSLAEITSGIIREALKTLMLGGMVRLGAKWLKK